MGRFYTRIILISLVAILSGGMLNAQTLSWKQIGADITGSGNFGKNVSFNNDGTIMAVGAPYPTGTGSVEVYENQNGTWTQLGSTLTGDASTDNFGRNVSLNADGTVLAVGAPYDGDYGYVRIYEYSGGSWVAKGSPNKISGTEIGDLFGFSVSLSGDGSIVAIGAYLNTTGKGQVSLFEIQGGTWTPIGVIPGQDYNEYFGYSVSLSSDGNMVAAGAYYNDDFVTNAGVTRVYYNNSGSWDPMGTDIFGKFANDRSGAAVSFNSDATKGTKLAVGSFYKTVSTNAQTGCVRVYEYSGGDWSQIGSDIDGTNSGAQFGKSVDLNDDGSMFVAGAPVWSSVKGKAKVYKYNSGTGNYDLQIGTDILGTVNNYGLGYSVAINNDGTVVGIGTDAGNLARAFSTNTTWTGAVNVDWATAGNWDVNEVPDANRNVVIPVGATNYPTLTGAASCYDLTIQSSADGTGSLIGQSNLTVSGAITVQRYLTGVDKWHLISSPAPGQTVASFLTSNSKISSKGTSPVYRAMSDYDEGTNLWNSFFTDAQAGNMTAGKGFEILTNADGVVTFTGTMESSTVLSAVTTSGDGWNCLGNPYPSAIYMNEEAYASDNFLTVNSASIDDGSYQAVYVWNPVTSSYDITGSAGSALTIAAGQAFMVKAKTAGNLSFTTAMQNHNSSVEFKGGIGIQEIKLFAKMAERTSSTKINFREGMSDGLDVGYDVGMFKTDFNLYTRLIKDNGVDFGIQYLPENYLKSSEIALGFESNTSGTVELFAELTNLPEGISVVLEDRLTGTFTELNDGDVYSVQVEKSESAKGRFYLHTSSAVTSVDGITTDTNFNAYYSNERIVIAGQVNGKAKAMLFDVMGRKITDIELERSTFNFIPTSGMKNGIYMLNIQYESGMYSKKIAVSR